MAMAVHKFTDIVNLQTVLKSIYLRVYKFIELSCQNTDFQSPPVNIAAVVTCLQTYC